MTWKDLAPRFLTVAALAALPACEAGPPTTPFAPPTASLQTGPGLKKGGGPPPFAGKGAIRLPVSEIQPTRALLDLLAFAPQKADLFTLLALSDLTLRGPLVGREMVLLGLFYDDGELQRAELSDPFTGGGSLAGLLDGSLVPSDQLVPGSQYLPGDELVAGGQYLPGALVIPGDPSVPGEQSVAALKGWPITGIVDGVWDREPDEVVFPQALRDASAKLPHLLLVAFPADHDRGARGDGAGPGIFVVFFDG